MYFELGLMIICAGLCYRLADMADPQEGLSPVLLACASIGLWLLCSYVFHLGLLWKLLLQPLVFVGIGVLRMAKGALSREADETSPTE